MTPALFFAGWARVAAGSLAAAIWQGVALAAVASLVLRMAPRLAASVRFAIWFGVFAVVAALPVVFVLHGSGAASAHGAALTLGAGWSVALAGVWLVASLVRAATLIAAAVRLRTLWKRARPVDLHVPAAGHRCAQLCVSDEVDRPSVIGFFAPRILMPAWLLEKLTPGEIEQIVLHEAGHLHRADDWLNLLQKLALVLFPLNPALLWLERRLCFERELACDEHVLRETGAPKAYAACLASLAEYRMGRRGGSLSLALGMAGAFGRQSELAQRVGRILTRKERMAPWQARLVLGGSLAALLVTTGELAQCPELVAFSATQPVAVAAAAPRRAAVSAHVQDVVFHPTANPSSRPADPTHLAPRRPALDPGRGHTEVGSARHAQPAGTEWVIVTTAWDAAGNSHMLFQTLSVWRPARPGVSQKMSAQNASAQDTGAQKISAVASEPAHQVSPYAAVPVRDGWLVFEM